ncbi:MAG: SagB/ThcOx family dehydrogenase [Candidatus Omnitrophota bacterium]
MKKSAVTIVLFFSIISGIPIISSAMSTEILLPKSDTKINVSLLEALQKRSSCRRFKNQPLNKAQISQILWAAGGQKPDNSLPEKTNRTIPSAGAIYPLEIFILIGENSVPGIKAGLYQYNVSKHSLIIRLAQDLRKELVQASLNQMFIKDAPISIIISAQYNRTTSRYGERGTRYVHMEAGHSCQNIYLIVENLGLKTVEVGAFSNEKVKKVLQLSDNLEPLAIMPVGYSD